MDLDGCGSEDMYHLTDVKKFIAPANFVGAKTLMPLNRLPSIINMMVLLES